jgi:biopolymer transport protein ExbD
MRFPRQARIFRGHLDPAPLAGVMFLLVIFMQLSSLLYTPGVLVQLKDSRTINNPAANIHITSDGRVFFATNVFSATNLDLLRPALKASTAGPPFGLEVEPSAPRKLVEQVRALFGMELADGPANLTGTADPKVVVAVNFLGQYFCDNRLMGEEALQQELKKRLQAASRESKELVLMVWADKQADFNAVSRLEKLAREAGITRAEQVERSVVPAPISPNSRP